MMTSSEDTFLVLPRATPTLNSPLLTFFTLNMKSFQVRNQGGANPPWKYVLDTV